METRFGEGPGHGAQPLDASHVQRDRELSAAANRRRHPWLMAWWRIMRVVRWTWRSPSYLIAQLGFRVSKVAADLGTLRSCSSM